MKISKPQSLTTDTRLSQSHFFNNSLLNKTNLTTSSQKYHHIPNSFQQEDSKEADFLKVKNLQLQQRMKRMSQQIKDLQDNKVQLLKMNGKYVAILNQYYRDSDNTKTVFQRFIDEKKQNVKNNFKSQERPSSKTKQQKLFLFDNKKQTVQKQKSYSQLKESNKQLVLSELEKDHRNLTRHCLIMQSQIKNYIMEMDKFNQMKAQLLAVNHTTPKQLIAELQDVVFQNRDLKKQNNRLSFQLQKCRAQCNKLKKAKQTQNKNISSNNDELQKLKAQINKVTQESIDKANKYQQRIYDLQLKCQKLQKQLRNGQVQVVNIDQKRKELQIERVEHVHENSYLRSSLTELLDPKKHPLLKLDRSFVYKKKKDKSISLCKTINPFK